MTLSLWQLSWHFVAVCVAFEAPLTEALPIAIFVHLRHAYLVGKKTAGMPPKNAMMPV